MNLFAIYLLGVLWFVCGSSFRPIISRGLCITRFIPKISTNILFESNVADIGAGKNKDFNVVEIGSTSVEYENKIQRLKFRIAQLESLRGW